MAVSVVDKLDPRTSARWDAEFYASEYRDFIVDMFAHWPEWTPLTSVAARMSSGHTPRNHDLELGDAALITVECVDPLFLNSALLKRVERHHVDRELRRAAVKPNDVVITIKRRLLNAATVSRSIVPAACNQDVVVL